jgi:hypothetical protein
MGGLPPVRAATVESLYDVEVPVSSQDLRERERALRAGLLQVVVRASGQRRVTPAGVLSAVLQNPSRYVQEFRYAGASEGGDARGRGAGQRLWIRFNPASTNELLRQAGLPVWGARPTVIVWLALQEAQGPRLVSAGEPAAVVATLRARAAARGVPLALPTLDEAGQARLLAADIAAERNDRAVQASRRYHAEAVLVGRARERVPGLWEARWTLVAGDATERFSVDGEQIEQVAGEGLDRAVDLLAARNARVAVAPPVPAPGAGPGRSPELTVAGLSGFGEYARVRRYLEGVETVTAVRVVRMGAGGVTFHLTAEADRDALSRSIVHGGVLAPVPSSDTWTLQPAP